MKIYSIFGLSYSYIFCILSVHIRESLLDGDLHTQYLTYAKFLDSFIVCNIYENKDHFVLYYSWFHLFDPLYVFSMSN